jgi:hypothetical protein
MLAKLNNSWTLFLGLLVGIVLLMFSQRPDLQSRTDDTGPGKTIAIFGHVLTWSSASVLGYRMVRGIREHGMSEEIVVTTKPEPVAADRSSQAPPSE